MWLWACLAICRDEGGGKGALVLVGWEVVRGRGWKQNRTALTTEPKDRREDREDLQIEKACSRSWGVG